MVSGCDKMSLLNSPRFFTMRNRRVLIFMEDKSPKYRGKRRGRGAPLQLRYAPLQCAKGVQARAAERKSGYRIVQRAVSRKWRVSFLFLLCLVVLSSIVSQDSLTNQVELPFIAENNAMQVPIMIRKAHSKTGCQYQEFPMATQPKTNQKNPLAEAPASSKSNQFSTM